MKKIGLLAFCGALHALSVKDPVCIFRGNSQEENIYHFPYITKDNDELVLCLKQQGRYKQMLASVRQPLNQWSSASVISDWQTSFNHLFIDRINAENFGIYWSDGKKKSASVYGVLWDPKGYFSSPQKYFMCQEPAQLLAIISADKDRPNVIVSIPTLDLAKGKNETCQFFQNFENKLLPYHNSEIATGRLYLEECYLDITKQGHGSFIYLKNDQLLEQKIANFEKQGEISFLAARHYDIEDLTFHEKDHSLDAISYIADCKNFSVLSKVHDNWQNTFSIPLDSKIEPVFKLGYLSSGKQALCLFEKNLDDVLVTLITHDNKPINAKLAISNSKDCLFDLAYLTNGLIILILEKGSLSYILFDENTNTWSLKKPLIETSHFIENFSIFQANEQKILLSLLYEQDNLNHVQLIEITP